MKKIIFTKEDIEKYPFFDKTMTPYPYCGENMSEGWDLVKKIFEDSYIFIDKNHKYSYEECDNRIAELRYLIHNIIPNEQAKIALVCQNSVEFALMFLAIVTLNDVAILLPNGASFEDIDKIVSLTNASLLVYGDEKYNDYKTINKLSFKATSKEKYPKVYGKPNDDCVYILTSGTTSTSKIVVYSNASLQRATYACGTLAAMNVNKEDKVNFTILPTSHIFGLSAGFLNAFYCGVATAFSNDFLSIIQDMNTYKPIITSLVPSIIKAIVDKVKDYNINPFPSSLKLILTGGETLDTFYFTYLEKFGISLNVAYTFTEAMGGTMCNNQPTRKPGSLGLAMPYVDCKIIDGELCVKAPYFASRYLDSAIPLDEDGYYHSNDLVRKDEDGFYYFEGRKSDLIKIHGQRINLFLYENDLQNYLKTKIILSYIDNTLVLFSESINKEKEYRELLKDKYPSYMQPQVMIFIEKFPILKNGKTDYKALKDYYKIENIGTNEDNELLNIMRKVISCPTLNEDDDFFAHGGDSLSIYVIMSEFKNPYLTIEMFYKYRRASKINNILNNIKKDEDIQTIPTEGFDLNPMQKYILKACKENYNFDYNLTFLVTFSNEYDEEDIQFVLNNLLANHPSLNMVLSSKDDKLYYKPNKNLKFEIINHKFNDANSLIKPIEIYDNPLYQIYILKDNDQYGLFFNLSHLIFDGSSVNAILNDLTALKNNITPNKDYYFKYQSHIANKEVALIDGKYMEEQYEKYLNSANYLPSDKKIETSKCLIEKIDLSLKTSSIKNILKKYNISLQTLFITLLALLMKNRNKNNNVSLSFITDGHNTYNAQNSVGCFIQENLINFNINDDTTFKDLCLKASQKVDEAYLHQNWNLDTFKNYLNINELVSFLCNYNNANGDMENNDFKSVRLYNDNFNFDPMLIEFELNIKDELVSLTCEASASLFSKNLVDSWLNEINDYLNKLNNIETITIKELFKK